MRSLTPVLSLLLLVSAPLATAATVSYPAPDLDPVVVDLVTDAGDTITWTLLVSDLMDDNECLPAPPAEGEQSFYPTDVSTATVTVTEDVAQDPASFIIALQRNVLLGADSNSFKDDDVRFTGSLSVDSNDLFVADWAMDLTLRDRFGVSYDCGDVRELDITADDQESPSVTFPAVDEDGVVRLAYGQSLQPVITDALLGEVSYRIDRTVDGKDAGMPQGFFYPKASPYIFSAKSFYPGEQTLTIQATDRAGNPATLASVVVFKDDLQPELSVNLTDRTPFFAGVNNTVNVTVSDDTDYTVTARFQDQVVTDSGDGGVETNFTLRVPAVEVGFDVLRIRVEDAYGNVRVFSQTIEVTQFTTDALIEDLDAEDGPHVLGDDVEVTVAMEQVGAAAEVNFTLRVDGEELGFLIVPADGLVETTLVVAGLPPGLHDLSFRAEAPEGVLVKNQTNLTADFQVEVFFAQVIVDGDDFFVRVGDNGLPVAVVDEDGDEHDVELVELGRRSVYEFETDDVKAYWDPAGPRVQDFEEAETEDPEEESPGVGAVVLLAVLGALAVALRRRD